MGVRVQEPLNGFPTLQIGTLTKGVFLDVFGNFQTIDCRVPHAVTSFSGERFSLVYFSHSSYLRSSPKLYAMMRRLGFNLPSQRQRAHFSMHYVDDPIRDIRLSEPEFSSLYHAIADAEKLLHFSNVEGSAKTALVQR